MSKNDSIVCLFCGKKGLRDHIHKTGWRLAKNVWGAYVCSPCVPVEDAYWKSRKDKLS